MMDNSGSGVRTVTAIIVLTVYIFAVRVKLLDFVRE